jgi:hypothetical protein
MKPVSIPNHQPKESDLVLVQNASQVGFPRNLNGDRRRMRKPSRRFVFSRACPGLSLGLVGGLNHCYK